MHRPVKSAAAKTTNLLPRRHNHTKSHIPPMLNNSPASPSPRRWPSRKRRHHSTPPLKIAKRHPGPLPPVKTHHRLLRPPQQPFIQRHLPGASQRLGVPHHKALLKKRPLPAITHPPIPIHPPTRHQARSEPQQTDTSQNRDSGPKPSSWPEPGGFPKSKHILQQFLVPNEPPPQETPQPLLNQKHNFSIPPKTKTLHPQQALLPRRRRDSIFQLESPRQPTILLSNSRLRLKITANQ